MSLEEELKKRVDDIKTYGPFVNNPLFVMADQLVEKISSVVIDHLKENGVDNKIDAGTVHTVYFSLCWSLARFVKVIDNLTSKNTADLATNILALCLEAGDINDRAIEIGKEGN